MNQERKIPGGRLSGFDSTPAADPMPTPSLPPRRPATPTTKPEVTKAPDVATNPAGRGLDDRVKPSNVHVSVELIEPFSTWCQQMGLSHGEGIIYILEATHDQLPQLINPPTTAGGSLFASRRSHPARPTEGPRTPLNYRMRNEDFAILDQLVEQHGATSRGHLISTAITAYLNLKQ